MKNDTFDKGFTSALSYVAAVEAAERADTPEERIYWGQEAARLGRQITPAAKQAAIPLRRMVISEARKWFEQHGGRINVSDLIAHIRTLKIDSRYYPALDNSAPLSDSALRKIVASAGFHGKAGRPRKR